MKKLRLIIRIITIILLVVTLAGIALLVASDHGVIDTTYEIIAFSLGAAGMVLSILSQIDSYQQEKTTRKMIDDLTALNRDADENDKVDAKFQKELDALLDMDAKIYRKLSRKK
jgi:hypothetical protein